MHKSVSESLKPQRPHPDKLFYRIGEISRIIGVEPYVLRYWETEFPFLKPRKNKSGQRIYVKRDLELLLHVKRLLYQERFTIEGARKRLEYLSTNIESKPENEPQRVEFNHPARVIELIKKRLKDILGQLQ
ncbi:MAG: MerR family transcriptional regulator [Nitrospirota bacterium]